MKALQRFVRRLTTGRRLGGPPVPDHVYRMIRSVTNPRERSALRQQPLQANERLKWVAEDRRVPVAQILAEIAGAGTAIGVILKAAHGPCLGSVSCRSPSGRRY